MSPPIPEATSDAVDWFKYVLGIIVTVLTAVFTAFWKATSSDIKDLRTKLDEKVDASTLTADKGDDQIWEELRDIREAMQRHDRNDATVHMDLSTRIAGLASRDDLNRALDVQTDKLLARLGREKL